MTTPTSPTPPALRLTSLSHGAGCACKLSLDELRGVLDGLPAPDHPDLVVGHATGDDAAVWRSATGGLLVATTDFFTPVVDDPRTWGRIAAANAVSDVYAMGATPRFALNLVGWPRDLPFELLAEVLAGAQDVATEAGYVIAGGHSIDSSEPLFGQAVIGDVAEADLLTNAGAQDGDALVLSKPIGTGIVMTALKRGADDADPSAVPGYDAAVASMTRLNRIAAELAVRHGAHAATDVTGFGLLGHLHRLADASRITAHVDAASVPLIAGVQDLVAAGLVPGGTQRNLEQAARFVAGRLDPVDGAVLCDAQTSGGLLVAVPAAAAAGLVADLVASGHQAARIGVMAAGPSGAVHVSRTLP